MINHPVQISAMEKFLIEVDNGFNGYSRLVDSCSNYIHAHPALETIAITTFMGLYGAAIAAGFYYSMRGIDFGGKSNK